MHRRRILRWSGANLSRLPAALVALVAKHREAERTGGPVDGLAGDGGVSIGPTYGPLMALRVLVQECGIERTLRTSREPQLALFLVLASVLQRGSRLSSARWAQDEAVAEALGSFDEEDLYAALDDLEGRQNELAAPGYNRDGKKSENQIVIGLLTDAAGEPVSVQVYRGHPADPGTVGDQADQLRGRFDTKEVVLVGDRGMRRGSGREPLEEHGFRCLTSLTEPDIGKAPANGTLQIGSFDGRVGETTGSDDRRHI